ncbi:vacuolar protein sorting-associated protein 37B-like isoform X1 [Neocloeon triangulifer]|uniref:vacuolar protein sorting-associated protein 37B-like isoform X1 n=2 Tax=Neocloeon triangulifer TaxID=2078957 RepID=UPI00286ED2F4|nr:vacuolar protein sorting-associated protein 37B-like isoform X1 [Neocloeon triangulifer]
MYSNFQSAEPDLSAGMGLLAHLNVDELKDIVNNDGKFEDLLKDLKQNKSHESEKELLLASNRSLADFNLTYEPKLREGKERFLKLSERAQELCQSVQAKSAELAQKSGNMSLDSALDILKAAAAESEEESDALAEQYMSSEIELDPFIDQFLVQRKQMHLRRVKADKMAEILASPLESNPPPIPARLPYPLQSTPYPVSNNNMPYPPF